MRILLVEDDADLAAVTAMGLRNEAYAVDVARSVSEATSLLAGTEFDLACIDLGLPDGDGIDLVRAVAAGAVTRPGRVIVITARDAVADRVAGLDAGADDYLVKPYAFAELVARVRALARRSDAGAGGGATLRVGDVVLDTAAHRAWRDGVELTLTARELALLRYFLHHPGEVLSAERLLEHVCDSEADPFTTSVRVILSRLRRKLGDPPPITTVTGAGYRFEVPA
jgi:two-component system copper resistance phosphate regulon response regulator CusR